MKYYYSFRTPSPSQPEFWGGDRQPHILRRF